MAEHRKQFCELGPLAYKIAAEKEILRRHAKDLLSRERFAKTKSNEPLPVLLSEHSSHLIKKGPGIDPALQYNKVTNIELASAPGGLDADAAACTELRVIRAPGLPGRVAPVTAAAILRDTLYIIWREQGVLAYA